MTPKNSNLERLYLNNASEDAGVLTERAPPDDTATDNTRMIGTVAR